MVPLASTRTIGLKSLALPFKVLCKSVAFDEVLSCFPVVSFKVCKGSGSSMPTMGSKLREEWGLEALDKESLWEGLSVVSVTGSGDGGTVEFMIRDFVVEIKVHNTQRVIAFTYGGNFVNKYE